MLLAERLRVERDLAWLSYSDAKSGRYVGVWRRPDGAVVLNISAPDTDGGRPHEHVVMQTGELVLNEKQPSSTGYDPRKAPWFTRAMAGTRIVWSEPYVFAEGNKGITASRSWRQNGTDAPQGVFTVDFFLRDIDKRLASLSVKVNGFSCIMAGDGKLISSTQSEDQLQLADSLKKLITDSPYFQFALHGVSTKLQTVYKGKESYLTALYMLETSTGFRCIVASMTPESVVYAKVNAARNGMLSVGIIGFLFAFFAIIFIDGMISKPLGILAQDFERVRQFQLGSDPLRPSILHEVNVLRDTSSRMKSGLRSFSLYVDIDVVREVISKGEDAKLGVSPRDITIFFSDIEAFTTHSEKVKPEVLVEELSVYYEVFTNAITRQFGKVDKIMGDGMLAYFKPSEKMQLHHSAACLAALAGLRDWEEEVRKGQCAPFRTRIGLHCGEVLFGNMGTKKQFARTIIGDPVNTASRLESLNKVYGTQIIASGQVEENVARGFEWRHLDRVAVAGRQGGMELYELLGVEGESNQSILYARDIYENALNEYFAQKFSAAHKLFDKAVQERPGDKAAMLMLKRCAQLMENSPEVAWDGVYAYKEK
ncbi:MAG: adenylate/guanylate cyclase domain-containing protein [Candidatus Methylacidiphilales bacterium]